MFYIFDCDTEEYFTIKQCDLYHFVNKEGTVFGNLPQQKRNFKKKVLTHGVWWNDCMGIRLIKYIVYDKFMNLVDYEVLEQWALNNKSGYKQFSLNRLGTHEFRNGPVPGIRKCGSYHYHRRPRTRNEMRSNCDPDHINYIRKGRWLPSSWDDLKISSRDIKRSWKKNKKKRQWM
jgi:hypothetical protein